MLAFRSSPLSLGSGGAPERIRGQAVSGSFFPTLGVRAALGRLLAPTDDVRGGAERIATISYQLWQRRFGGRPEILGQSILINGREFRLVGVAAPDFRGPSIRDAADVWVPFAIWPELRSSEPGLLDNRRSSWLSVMGRLRPDASVARAQASLSRVAAHLETTYPQADKNRGVAVDRRRLARATRRSWRPLSSRRAAPDSHRRSSAHRVRQHRQPAAGAWRRTIARSRHPRGGWRVAVATGAAVVDREHVARGSQERLVGSCCRSGPPTFSSRSPGRSWRRCVRRSIRASSASPRCWPWSASVRSVWCRL